MKLYFPIRLVIVYAQSTFLYSFISVFNFFVTNSFTHVLYGKAGLPYLVGVDHIDVLSRRRVSLCNVVLNYPDGPIIP